MRGISALLAIVMAISLSACVSVPRNEGDFVRQAIAGQYVPVPNVRGNPPEKVIRACGAYTYAVNRGLMEESAARGFTDAMVYVAFRALGLAVVGRDLGAYEDALTMGAIDNMGRGALNGARVNGARVRNSFSRCMAVNGLPGEFAWKRVKK